MDTNSKFSSQTIDLSPQEIQKDHELQKRYFDDKATSYESGWLLKRSLDCGYERKAEIVQTELRSFKDSPMDVLEVGAGTGLLSFWLMKSLNIKTYLGTDISDAMLEVAIARFSNNEKISFKASDACDLSSIPNEQFNFIVGGDIVHHVSDPVKGFSEWLRVAKPGGRMLMLEGNIYHPVPLYFHIGNESEARFYLNTDYNLKKWAIAAGWSNVSVTPSPIFTPWTPKFLRPLYRVIDKALVKVPFVNKFSAVWIVSGYKPI